MSLDAKTKLHWVPIAGQRRLRYIIFEKNAQRFLDDLMGQVQFEKKITETVEKLVKVYPDKQEKPKMP